LSFITNIMKVMVKEILKKMMMIIQEHTYSVQRVINQNLMVIDKHLLLLLEKWQLLSKQTTLITE